DINVRETNGDTPLIIACQTGSADIALYLLEHGAEINHICECGNTALYVATFTYNRHENITMMKSLLDHGANLNLLCQYRLTPLMVAAKDSLEEVTELFLEYGADPNFQDSDGDTALSMACIRNNQIIVDILLRNDKVDLNLATNEQFTPLMIACIKWDTIITMIKFLLKQPGINVNVQNNKGYTPLILACYKHNETIARLLIQHGADVNIATHKKVTPLMMACQNRSFILVDLLLQQGAQVNIQNDINGDTALIISSRFYYNFNITKKLLVEGKANVNICNKNNETALILACYSNNIKYIKLLIDHGADVNVQEGKKGLTPLMIAL
ncbi:hypothetical protein PIROE2DRAFT_27019, partial [Piromyces sp. E2]